MEKKRKVKVKKVSSLRPLTQIKRSLPVQSQRDVWFWAQIASVLKSFCLRWRTIGCDGEQKDAVTTDRRTRFHLLRTSTETWNHSLQGEQWEQREQQWEQWEQWEQLAVGCLARGHLDMEQRLFIYKGPPVKLCDSGLQEEPDLRVWAAETRWSGGSPEGQWGQLEEMWMWTFVMNCRTQQAACSFLFKAPEWKFVAVQLWSNCTSF